jgi:hypothetical protein
MQTTQSITLPAHCVPIFLEDVLDEVIKLSQEMPDFVYSHALVGEVSSGCKYTRGGSDKYDDCCGCIIGQAIIRSAPPEHRQNVIYALKQIDAWMVTTITNLVRIVNSPASYDRVRIDTIKFAVKQSHATDDAKTHYVAEILTKLGFAQDKQDENNAWETAVKAITATEKNIDMYTYKLAYHHASGVAEAVPAIAGDKSDNLNSNEQTQ